MPNFSATLQDDPAYRALVLRLDRLERKANTTSTMAFAQQEKRYRLALATMNSLISLGGTVTATVSWSSPMASVDYKVDVAVGNTSGAAVSGDSIVVTNKTVNGCTVAFPAPVALILGTIVGVLAISAPSS